MCRNIKVLYNFDPPASHAEIHEASLQFVRKISGYREPSDANQKAFDRAVADISQASSKLLGSLITTTNPRDRKVEAAKAHARAIKRFGS